MVYKIVWGLITLLYLPFFKKLALPSYIGVPLFTSGLSRVSIERRVRIFPGLRMETHQGGTITIEEDVSIAQNFHITSAGSLVIGNNTTILGNVFITNIDHEYQEIGLHILKQKMKVRETTIGSNCFIGYGVAIQAGTTLGKHCVVGTHSVVRGHFPDYCVIVGAPARIVKKYNTASMRWEKVNQAD